MKIVIQKTLVLINSMPHIAYYQIICLNRGGILKGY